MLVRYILYVLVLLFLARAIWRLFEGIARGISSPEGSAAGQRPASPPAMKMALDPICGTYVVPGKALQLTRGRETNYFCSDKCRDEWVRRAK